jgi:hypothetical protein
MLTVWKAWTATDDNLGRFAKPVQLSASKNRESCIEGQLELGG